MRLERGPARADNARMMPGAFRFAPFALALALAGSAPPATGAAVPEPPAAVVVHGDSYGFRVDTPAGWLHDCDALGDRGICALFYRPGETFESASVVLYVGTGERDRAGLSSFMAAEAAEMRAKAPRLVVCEEPSLPARDGRLVRVRRFEHAVGPTTTELVGYLEEQRRTILFVASARTPGDLERERPAFEALVRSYARHGDTVAATR